jgi:acyl-CoA thioesterase-1
MNRKDGAWRVALQRTMVMVVVFFAFALPASAAAPRTVLVMGDSLSAAYNLRADEGWVALMEQKLRRERPGWKVVNASISGETSAGGATRIVAEVRRHRPAVVIIELGANDGLRGLDIAQTRVNLARMIGAAHGVGAKVLLVGIRLPPNFGPAYVGRFEATYPELSKRFGTALLPFLLEPVAADRANFQADQMHPVAAAQPRLRDHVWPALEPLLH